ncbi:MAG: lytic transglycosylase domain-containing protein [Pseudomonadota bacterium]
MKALRSVLTLVRVLGVVAVAIVVYAWMYPERLGQWLGREQAEAQAEAQAAAASEVAASATPPVAAPAAVAPAPTPAIAAPAASAQPPAVAAAETVHKAVKASRSQAAMAQWLGSKYRVSPSMLEILIVEADKLSKTYKLSPNLIIAVMAIESNFHPYIQSEAGAQGLMQVMPAIHAKRYEKFGGKSSFIDPIVSLKVGAEILRDCMKLKGGSEDEALRFYFGGGASSGAYIDKVRAEQRRLNMVAAGKQVAVD